MLADLDVLLTAVLVSADDLLRDRAGDVRRSVTGAEVLTGAAARRPGWHAARERFGATVLRPARKNEPGRIRAGRLTVGVCEPHVVFAGGWCGYLSSGEGFRATPRTRRLEPWDQTDHALTIDADTGAAERRR
jgi:hypothetical protein